AVAGAPQAHRQQLALFSFILDEQDTFFCHLRSAARLIRNTAWTPSFAAESTLSAWPVSPRRTNPQRRPGRARDPGDAATTHRQAHSQSRSAVEVFVSKTHL